MEGEVSEIRDVRVSDIRPGQEWLLDGAWVAVTDVEVKHPDDRVTIEYEHDGERQTTREYRGFERAAVRQLRISHAFRVSAVTFHRWDGSGPLDEPYGEQIGERVTEFADSPGHIPFPAVPSGGWMYAVVWGDDGKSIYHTDPKQVSSNSPGGLVLAGLDPGPTLTVEMMIE
jgi:hypothetical protein